MWCTSPGRGGWRCRAPSLTLQRRTTMASPATSSHLPALAEPHQREAIAHGLQSTMQELVDLSLIGKQLHWAVVGHAFRPVHEQLDELVASWRDLADVVAERAVALGYVPDGQARAVAAGSPLSPVASFGRGDREPRRGTGHHQPDRAGQRDRARAHGPNRRARRGLAGRADRRRARARAPAVDAARPLPIAPEPWAMPLHRDHRRKPSV